MYKVLLKHLIVLIGSLITITASTAFAGLSFVTTNTVTLHSHNDTQSKRKKNKKYLKVVYEELVKLEVLA